MLDQVPERHSLLGLNDMHYTTSNGHVGCFYFFSIMKNAAWTFMYKVLCGQMFAFLLGTYLMELLGHMLTDV